MTEAGKLIQSEIRAHGPMPFSRFMQIALYHPQFGYYRCGQKIFGRDGDFYTASQLQPVFGRLLAQGFEKLHAPAQQDGRVIVADWGAGQSDLRETLGSFDYRAVDIGRDEIPERFRGIVLANELVDALPVDVARREGGVWRERRVASRGDDFAWVSGNLLDGEWLDYAQRAAHEAGWESDAAIVELPVALRSCLERIDRRLECGWIVLFDYGYTPRELMRFPQGTLMAYRKHRAYEDVLAGPSASDITAHVPFDELRRRARALGWNESCFEPMGQFLLRAGEGDQFAAALAGPSEQESARLRLQLKSLLFDIGDMFRAIVWEKA
jgi:SAM-dependent MidA family methyltransferase